MKISNFSPHQKTKVTTWAMAAAEMHKRVNQFQVDPMDGVTSLHEVYPGTDLWALTCSTGL